MPTQRQILNTRNKTALQLFNENVGRLIANNDYGNPFTYLAQGAERNINENQISTTNGRRVIQNLLGLWKERIRTDLNAGRKPTGQEPRTNEYLASRNYAIDHAFTTGMPTTQPTATNIQASRERGYNVGQIGGARNVDDVFSINEIFHQVETLTRTGHLDVGGTLDALFEVSRAIGRLYQPGINRIPEPFLLRMPLDDLLKQNLILPSSIAGTKTATNVFSETYLANRARTASQPQGRIAGIPISDLQEPENPRVNPSQRRRPVFTFQNDDAVYLTSAKLDRGFTNNINVTTDTLNEAVIHSDWRAFQSQVKEVDITDNNAVKSAAESIESYGHTENQYFPFLFETENRSGQGEFKQYCFLQATLQSISESYSPNWNSTNFFGRTEQIRTYQNTDRSLSFSFVIFANSMREMQNVRERVTWLAQQCYASYDKDITANLIRMKVGPLLKITIGDFIRQLPGYLSNLEYDWSYGGQGGKWEMTKGLRMPQMCQVSVSYQVIHSVNPDRDFDFYYGLQGRMNDERLGALIPLSQGINRGPTTESFNSLLSRIG